MFFDLLFWIYHLFYSAVYIVRVLWMIEFELQISELGLYLICLFLIHKSVDLFSSCGIAFQTVEFWSLESFLSFANFVLKLRLSAVDFWIENAIHVQESLVFIYCDDAPPSVVHLT
jgi:hypothetical protein